MPGNWGSDGLRRAVENLIGNAVKYGDRLAPVTILVKRVGSMAEISVSNVGNPIDPNELPRLFDQYRRSRTAHEGSQTGWGLGLTLVKGVVDAHRGKIRVESSPRAGTCFTMEIPFAASPTVDGVSSST